ncbi:hypothetical protein HMI54_009907 [Coelomomyces lativittatus]|nr:hypothetical protein HMI55_003814 [Coelomomyces lativittatus]KAJ1501502.1 hypothetical protein HMI54_009907 [Coelomomyces lativittatus]KAJ1511782.1 hypothetical protein HMI56_004958 [Coelomomyces lativittatus]
MRILYIVFTLFMVGPILVGSNPILFGSLISYIIPKFIEVIPIFFTELGNLISIGLSHLTQSRGFYSPIQVYSSMRLKTRTYDIHTLLPEFPTSLFFEFGGCRKTVDYLYSNSKKLQMESVMQLNTTELRTSSIEALVPYLFEHTSMYDECKTYIYHWIHRILHPARWKNLQGTQSKRWEELYIHYLNGLGEDLYPFAKACQEALQELQEDLQSLESKGGLGSIAVNYLLLDIRAKFARFFGDTLSVVCATWNYKSKPKNKGTRDI